MIEYFKQIDLNFLNTENIKGKELFSYGRGTIRYSEISSHKLIDEINSKFVVLPKKYFFVEITNILDPHIDRGAESCLNYYIEAGDYITNFWRIINPDYVALETKRTDNLTKEKSDKKTKFRREDLDIVDTFTATNNSCYILNIGQIHTVEKKENNKYRSAIQLQWDCTFSDLNNYIVDSGIKIL